MHFKSIFKFPDIYNNTWGNLTPKSVPQLHLFFPHVRTLIRYRKIAHQCWAFFLLGFCLVLRQRIKALIIKTNIYKKD